MLKQARNFQVRVTATDHALFRYLYENKVATAAQIHRDIYPQYALGGVSKRLLKMIRSGLLQASQHRELGGRVVYSLGQRGFVTYVRPAGTSFRPELRSAVVGHDLSLVDVRKRLESSPQVKNYYSENLLKSGELETVSDSLVLEGIQPDAVVELQLPQKAFLLPVEYEDARKYDSRYQELFRKYYRNKAIPGVLYVCRDAALLNRVSSVEKRVLGMNHPKIYYSDFSNWASGVACIFTSLKGTNITLK